MLTKKKDKLNNDGRSTVICIKSIPEKPPKKVSIQRRVRQTQLLKLIKKSDTQMDRSTIENKRTTQRAEKNESNNGWRAKD